MSAILMRKGFLLLILIIGFYVGLSIYANVGQLVNHLAKIETYFIIPILLSFTCSMMIKGIRQKYFLDQIGITISFKQNILIYLAGLSMLITPAGIGEFIKSHFLKRNYGELVSKTFPMVILERYHDFFAVFTILLSFYAIVRISILIFPILIIGIILFLGFFILRNKMMFQKVMGKLEKIKFLKSFSNSSSQFSDVLFTLCKNKIFVMGWTISLIAWFFDAIGIYLCFKAFNLNFDFILSTVLGFSSILFGAFSFIPAGIGTTEISFVKLLSIYGLDISTSAALILFWRIMGDFYATCLGVIVTKIVLSQKQFE